MNLSDLMWYVFINGGTSVKHPLRCGVYQVSALVPIYHLLYPSPLSDIKRKFNSSYHFYADVSHLYLFIQPTIPGDRDLPVSDMESCVNESNHWMLVNCPRSK